jgi:DNA-binding NarL/FixJ family response regulator
MKVLLVDDHAILREGVAMLLQREFAGLEPLQAGTLAQALQALAAHADLGLVLLDLQLPDAAGLDALLRLRATGHEAAVVVLSADTAPERILGCIDAGAAGYVPKSVNAREMLDALRRVLGGQVFVPAQLPFSGRDLSTGALTPRQREVWALLVQGKSNKAICRQLGLSESTVKTHLAAIFEKLDVHSRTEAVVAAARLGLQLGPPPAA